MVFLALYFILGIFVLPHITAFNILSWSGFYIVGGIFILILIIDTIRYPEENWVRVKFILASAFKKESGPVVNEAFPYSDAILHLTRAGKGVFGGMPYMTNMSDPRNIASQINRIANGIGNLTLGGPRKLKEAISCYRLYARLNQDMEHRLSRFANSLKEYGGECNIDGCPLAIELDIIAIFRKLGSQSQGIRLN
jgi:hypothetical protein